MPIWTKALLPLLLGATYSCKATRTDTITLRAQLPVAPDFPGIKVTPSRQNAIVLEDYCLQLGQNEVIRLGTEDMRNLGDRVPHLLRKKVILTEQQLARTSYRQLVLLEIDRNTLNEQYKAHLMAELRKLGALLQDDPGIVLGIAHRKFEKGKSYAISLVDEAARQHQLKDKGFATHTYRRAFTEPVFEATTFLEFIGREQPYSSRSESGRYREVMIKATANNLNFENALLFLYSNHCDTCKRLTPVLEAKAEKDQGFKYMRMNYNRNYVRELPYFPFTPILLMVKHRAAFMFSSGSMNEFWLDPFLENPRRLQIIPDDFLNRLPQLQAI